MPTMTRPPQTALRLEEVDGNTMATMTAPLVAAPQCCSWGPHDVVLSCGTSITGVLLLRTPT